MKFPMIDMIVAKMLNIYIYTYVYIYIYQWWNIAEQMGETC